MKRFLSLSLILMLSLGFLSITACRTAKNTGTAVKEGTTEAAQETAEGAKAAGKKVEDASITAAVKMKMANDETVSASRIDVDTSNGIVTLNGQVRSQAEADRAVQLAKEVDGVKMVNNNLTVQPQ